MRPKPSDLGILVSICCTAQLFLMSESGEACYVAGTGGWFYTLYAT